eukprot:2844639-Alexandrium_andersonii.AAC.1
MGGGSTAVRLGGIGSRTGRGPGSCSRPRAPGRRPSTSPVSCAMVPPRMAPSARPPSGSLPRG